MPSSGSSRGLTEFLPISSTAHLRIVPALLGWEDPGAAFTAVTQLGTMAAVLVCFWGDLVRIGRAWLCSVAARRRPADLDARMGWYIVIGTIPIGVLGLAFRHQIENGARSLVVIGVSLIALVLLLLLAERLGRRGPWHRLAAATGRNRHRLRPGGCPRSGGVTFGATITGGLLLGLDRPAAARFSFLLSVPAVVLSGAFELLGLVRDGMGCTG